jgi:hypothetical protein
MSTGTKSCRTTSTDMADIHPIRDVILSTSDEVRYSDSGGVHRTPETGDARRISTENIYNHVRLNGDLAISSSMQAPARPANFPCQPVVCVISYLPYKSVAAAMPVPRPSLTTKKASEIAQFLCNVSPFRMNSCKSVSKQRTLTAFRMNTCEKTRGRGVSRFRSPRIRFLVTQKRFLRSADAL